jgi:restriction endonuclease Mrr
MFEQEPKHALTMLNRLAERKPEHEQFLRRALVGRLEQLEAVALEVESESGGPIGRILRELQKELSEKGDDSGEVGDSVAIIVRTMTESLCTAIAKDPRSMRQIEWRDMERVIAAALEKIGFTVKLTAPAKDGGKDVIASCFVENREKIFYVEIKHWVGGGRPGLGHVSNFIEVNAVDKADGGLFLSSSGYTESVYNQVTEISRQRVRLGQGEKIVSLCRHFVQRENGVWYPDRPLPELLFEHTLTDNAGLQIALLGI